MQLFTESFKKLDFLFIKIDAKSISCILEHFHIISEEKTIWIGWMLLKAEYNQI